MKAVQVTKPATIKLLAYGDSGVGKTTLIGSFTQCEATSPVLVLNAGGQPVSLRAFSPPPLVLEIETLSDFNAVYYWLDAGQPWEWVEKNHRTQPLAHHVKGYFPDRAWTSGFKTIAIDSITQVQRISMDHLTEAESVGPGDYSKGMQIQHWGQILSQMVRLADKYFKLPINVVMTALTRRSEIEAMGTTLFSPFLLGQGNLQVPAHAEIVGRLVALETLRAQTVTAISAKYPSDMQGAFNVLLTRGGRNFMAKWQGVASPPDMVVGPTAQRMMEILNG
jgi:hypothetical protein